MPGQWLFLLLCVLATAGYMIGHRKAVSVSGGSNRVMHSLMPYHGWNVALAAFLSGIAAMVAWGAIRSITGIPDGSNVIGTVLTLGAAGAAFWLSLQQISREFRARNSVETMVKGILILASSIAILTTVGSILSMLFVTANIFGQYS